MKIANTDAGIPARWLSALRAVQTKFPEAVIAGGALRDLANGRDVKDVDIWIKTRGEETKSLLEAALDCPVIDIADLSVESQPATEGELDDVFNVDFPVTPASVRLTNPGELIMPDDAPIQIIAVNFDVTMDSVIERFDFGICKAATDGRVSVLHPSFLADVERKTFTFLATNRSETQMDRSLVRYQRLTGDKYAGWTLRGMEPKPASNDFDWMI